MTQSAAAVDRTIDVQAHLLAANDVFQASALLFVGLIGVIWLARRPKTALPSGAGAEAH
jgi:DHA2 family multidrug resistance protein